MTADVLDVAAIQDRLRHFAAARDWEQFHNPKNLSTAVVVEAAELAEAFQWLTPSEAMNVSEDHDFRERVAEEVADIFIYLLRFADIARINVAAAVIAKIDRNESRFPKTGA
jgi:NTP pyrophosphatase (non-canonical NTP hydrolase)